MSFWWEEKNYKENRIPSLDTGLTNATLSIKNESIFTTENFKNISSMFTETELKVAKYKGQNRTTSEIAQFVGISEKEVLSMINTMQRFYYSAYKDEDEKQSFRTIKSKKGR